MLRNNEFKYMLCQEGDFINSIKKGTMDAIKSHIFENIFYIKNKVGLFGYKNKDEAYLILINYEEELITIYHNNLIESEKNAPLKNIFKYEIEKFKNGEYLIYHTIVLEAPMDENIKDYGHVITEEMRSKVLEKLNKLNATQQVVNEILNNYKVGYLICNIKINADCSILKNYADFLYHMDFISDNYQEEFYIKNSQRVNDKSKLYLTEIMNNIVFLKEICVNNNYDENNKYDFNDGDYFYWQENDKLYIEDQNALFVVEIEDNDLTIFCISKDVCNFKESKYQLKENIKNKTTDLIKDVAFKIVNGDILYTNNSLMHYFYIDLNRAVFVSEENNTGKRKIMPLFSDVDYLIDYFYNVCGKSKFDMLANFFIDGLSDFKYHKKTESFFYKDIILLDEKMIKKEPIESQNCDFQLTLNNGKLKKFGKLNEQWLNALSEFRDYLTKNNPKLIDIEKSVERKSFVSKELDKESLINEIDLYLKKYYK